MQTIADRLRDLMIEQNVSGYALSKATGLSESSIGRILKNTSTPNESTLFAIASNLGTTVNWLRTGSGDKHDTTEKSIQQRILFPDTETVGSRVRNLLSKTGSSINEFVNITGIPYSKIYKGFSGEYVYTEHDIAAVVRAFPNVNTLWLMTGKGEPLVVPLSKENSKTPHEKFKQHEAMEVISKIANTEVRRLDEDSYLVTCPLIDKYSAKTYIASIADTSLAAHIARYTMSTKEPTIGEYLAVEIHDDSMDNGLAGSFPVGTIVAGRKIAGKSFRSKLEALKKQNRPFIFVTEFEAIVGHIDKMDDAVIGVKFLNRDKEKHPNSVLYFCDLKEIHYIRHYSQTLED